MAIWSIGNSIAARSARIRAAIHQCPKAVVNAITPKHTPSIIKPSRVCACRLNNAVTSKNNAIANPATLMTPSVRVTIDPAISLAFGKPNERKTPNAAGATTAPKKSAAPNHAASNANRVRLRIMVILSNQTRLLPATTGSSAG